MATDKFMISKTINTYLVAIGGSNTHFSVTLIDYSAIRKVSSIFYVSSVPF